MRTQKIEFQNAEGHDLSARLEMPADQHPYTYAIFAHCFTCNKNLSAVRNISRALTSNGVGVLRFDFTGLGESEGAFSDTNFSSNVQDLIAAANFLSDNYMPPEMLIGHSLGGAAVYFAAKDLPTINAIASIGAPADPEHVSHLLQGGIEELKKEGVATVNIGGRTFQMKKQFLEDIQKHNMPELLRELRKPILVMHSPQDRIVAIENAAKIYDAAFHPKSFISLGGADHLLSNKMDSIYAGDIIACWAKRFVIIPKKETLSSHRHVVARLGQKGYTTEIRLGQHGIIADEPESVGGNDFGPSPYELLGASLASCTVMTLQMYARRKKWDLREVIVHIDHKKDYHLDCADCEHSKSKIDHFTRELELEGELTKEQIDKLLEIADKCPVHRTLHNEVVVHTKIKRRISGV